MISGNRLRGSSLPLAVFAGVTVVSMLGLAWLSWRVIDQDQVVERQRWLDRCEVGAGHAAALLAGQLSELQRVLEAAATGRPAQILSGGVVVVALRGDSLEAAHGLRLPYYPALPDAPEAPAERFREAERLEFREKQPLRAAELYMRLAADAETRAGALVRLARVYRKAKLPAKALETYTALEGLGAVRVEGEPAEVLARLGRAEIYAEQNDHAALKREADEMARALAAGRWILRRSSYEYLAQQSRSLEPSREALALAEVAETAWRQWKDGVLNAASPQHRRSYRARGQSILALWDARPQQLVLLAAASRPLVAPLRQLPGLEISLEDSEGHPVLGNPAGAAALRAVRTTSVTGLPWTVYATPADRHALSGALSRQARLLLAALTLMILFTLIATVFVTRSIARELAVARLQSDFVAAVSHEFRSPLTTIMQLSELLVRGRISGDERRQKFYETLLSESRRLHRLVEGILNFGRFQSGKYEYRFQTVDLAELAQSVVEDFSASAANREHRVEFRRPDGAIPVRADREALGRVLWNLLENAVKYSPDEKTVWVDATGRPDGAVVSVRDRGIGIPPAEQKTIFAQFVRGSEAKQRSIQGAGIGLAMAKTIVEAHGGAIEVDSAPAQGSTFHLLLPRVEAP